MNKDPQRKAMVDNLSQLYSDMEQAYNHVATKIGLSCDGCPDNCCSTYFQHHTYIEWAYLWEGISALSEHRQREFLDRAEVYVKESRMLLAQGLRPRIMCPLNSDGLCQLYQHRLMICRLHGVPNTFVHPDGNKMDFPGCFRSQELCSSLQEVPLLDRTNLYRNLASLEITFVGPKLKVLPRVKLTLAEMLVQGPPRI